MTHRVSRRKFSGLSFIHDAADGGLASLVEGLAQDHAQLKLQQSGVADLVDNSGGVVAVNVVDLVIPTVVFDGQTSGASPAAAFDTAMNKIEDAGAVFADHVNNVRGRLGLPNMAFASGSIATAGTIAALDVALTATSGATAIDFTTGIARMLQAKQNLRKVLSGLNDITYAVGAGTLKDNMKGVYPAGLSLVAIANADAGTGTPAGATSISDTVMDAFLLAFAANVASMADKFNAVFLGGALTAFTNNMTGTSDEDVAAMTLVLTAHQDGATDSCPKAALDTELVLIDTNCGDIAERINELLGQNGLTELVINSGGSRDLTLDLIDVTLVAVDGTANVSAEHVSTQARFVTIANNVASLAAKANLLAVKYGAEPLVDSSGGTVGVSVGAVAATAAGVDNGAAATGVDDAESDAALVIVMDNLNDIADKMDEMVGTGVQIETPLHVVAVPF